MNQNLGWYRMNIKSSREELSIKGSLEEVDHSNSFFSALKSVFVVSFLWSVKPGGLRALE